MATSYQMLLDAVENYYGSGSDQWAFIFQNIGNVSESAQVAKLLQQVPGVDVTLSNSGRILDYNVRDVLKGFSTGENIGTIPNSNNVGSVVGESINASIPSVISKSKTTGSFGGVSGIGLTADTGVTATGVLSTIGVALGAVGVGAQLGKVVGRALYESNPDVWATDGLKALSKVDWDKFTVSIKDQAQEGILGLFGVNNNTTTMYLDENAVAYLTWYYNYIGALSKIDNISTDLDISPATSPFEFEYGKKIHYMGESGTILDTGFFSSDTVDRVAFWCESATPSRYLIVGASLSNAYLKDSYTHNGLTVYYGVLSARLGSSSENFGGFITSPFYIGNSYDKPELIAWSLMYGTIHGAGVDGITDNDNSTQFNPSGVGSVATSLGALKNQYPELWEKSIKKSVPQEDGTEDEHVYVPIPIPKFNGAFDTQPTTGTPSQSDPSISPDTTPDDELNNASNTIAPPSNPTDDPNTGGGNSPSVVIPTQQASALWAIYNPSLAQLNQLGSWLWSTNFIDQILKIFNDPMQAIIGLHKVYATPNISGNGNIKVGYLDSGVGSNIVGNQYTYIDCGTVSLREYYGNILDYSPYTTVQLYLPFIGIVPLDVADVTRASISVKYGVDVLTGSCLASVSVQRDNAGGVLYQYSGNCACQYPLSSGSYMGMLTGAIGAVGSLAKGNIFGTALSIAGMHTSIEHSGGFSGNAGAMGGKKPYLIVSRPQSAMNDGFPAIQGYPSNVFVTLGSCSGYVQVAYCHVENISATDKELEKIKQLLKEGVIL